MVAWSVSSPTLSSLSPLTSASPSCWLCMPKAAGRTACLWKTPPAAGLTWGGPTPTPMSLRWRTMRWPTASSSVRLSPTSWSASRRRRAVIKYQVFQEGLREGMFCRYPDDRVFYRTGLAQQLRLFRFHRPARARLVGRPAGDDSGPRPAHSGGRRRKPPSGRTMSTAGLSVEVLPDGRGLPLRGIVPGHLWLHWPSGG